MSACWLVWLILVFVLRPVDCFIIAVPARAYHCSLSNFVIGKRSHVLANIVLLKTSFIAPAVLLTRICVRSINGYVYVCTRWERELDTSWTLIFVFDMWQILNQHLLGYFWTVSTFVPLYVSSASWGYQGAAMVKMHVIYYMGTRWEWRVPRFDRFTPELTASGTCWIVDWAGCRVGLKRWRPNLWPWRFVLHRKAHFPP
jgi:hypothetical protein